MIFLPFQKNILKVFYFKTFLVLVLFWLDKLRFQTAPVFLPACLLCIVTDRLICIIWMWKYNKL